MKKLLIPLFILLSLTACKKTSGNTAEGNGIVKDYTGLDGCSVMIDLDNGKRLEIHSLPPGTTLIPGKRVFVKYSVAKNAYSICMAGEIADINFLLYL